MQENSRWRGTPSLDAATIRYVIFNDSDKPLGPILVLGRLSERAPISIAGPTRSGPTPAGDVTTESGLDA